VRTLIGARTTLGTIERTPATRDGGALHQRLGINLTEFGFLFSFPGVNIPSSVGPFSYFDARVNVTQSRLIGSRLAMRARRARA